MRRRNNLRRFCGRLPPGNAHLTRFIDGTYKQTDVDAQQLHVTELDFDVAHDDYTLVQHTLKDLR
jgi:hypothetical protein